jgi:DNA mismatch endonuclease (patch repair protein)
MSRIRSKNTTPEQKVRKALTAMGFRYRLNVKKLPGCPDVVIGRLKLAIFVHGCFWHRHDCKYGQPKPKTRPEFWEKKLQGNVERDQRNQQALKDQGWRVLVIWECQTKKPDELAEILKDKILTLSKQQ